MAATTGGEAGGLGGVTGGVGLMEIDGAGIGSALGVEAGEIRTSEASGQAGGTVAPGARACAGGTASGRAADLGAEAMAEAAAGINGVATAGSGDVQDGGGVGEAADGLRAQQQLEQELQQQPGGAKISGPRLKLIKEFWCLRAVSAYPKATEAAAAVRDYVMDAWGGLPQLKGFPVEVLVHEKAKNWEATPASTGMVKVTRAADDGWQAEGWIRLCQNAWPLDVGIDRCRWVKAFGSSNDHGREINWLMCSLHKFLAAGNSLSIDPKCVVFGYAELPPRVARLNGAEWSGFAYGANLPLQDLIAVVEWGGLMDKESKGGLKPELKVDSSRRGVVSNFIPAGQPGYRFQPADFIAGSFTLLIESKLTMLDFDLEASDSPDGIELLCEIFGDAVVLDVSPSIGGLVGTGIVRVKVKCGLRHEKEARAHAQALVQADDEREEPCAYAVGERMLEVHFHSEESARAMAELVESSSGGGRGKADNARAQLELKTVTSALAEVKEFQRQSVSRMTSLAEEQRSAFSSCAAKIEDLAKLQAVATVESKEKFEATQRQLADLALGQAQAAQDSREQLAEVQKQAFAFAQTLHLQLTESIGNFSAQLRKEKPTILHKGLHAAVENVPPPRLVARVELDLGATSWEGRWHTLRGPPLASVSACSWSLEAHLRTPSGSQRFGGALGSAVTEPSEFSRRYDWSSGEKAPASGWWAIVSSSLISLVGKGRSAAARGGVQSVYGGAKFTVGGKGVSGSGREEQQREGQRYSAGRGAGSFRAAPFNLVLLSLGAYLSAGVCARVHGDVRSNKLVGPGATAVGVCGQSVWSGQQFEHVEWAVSRGVGERQAQEGRGFQGAETGAPARWQEGACVHRIVVQKVGGGGKAGLAAAGVNLSGRRRRLTLQGCSCSTGAVSGCESSQLGRLVAVARQVHSWSFHGAHLQFPSSWGLGASVKGQCFVWKACESRAKPGSGEPFEELQKKRAESRSGEVPFTCGWNLATCRSKRWCADWERVAEGGECVVFFCVWSWDGPRLLRGGLGRQGRSWAAAGNEGARGSKDVWGEGHHFFGQTSVCREGQALLGSDLRVLARVPRLHPHGEPLMRDSTSACGGREHGSRGGSAICAGLGIVIGASPGRAESASWARSCARWARKGHIGAGCALRRCPGSLSAGLVYGSGDGVGDRLGRSRLHLPLLGHRHRCGRHGVAVQGGVEISTCGGGGSGGAEGAHVGVEREAGVLCRGCSWTGGQNTVMDVKRDGGHLLYELEVRSLVTSEHCDHGQDGEEGVLDAGGGRDAGAGQGGVVGYSEGGDHRVRVGFTCAPFSEVLELDVRLSPTAVRLDLVLASDRPGVAVSWQLAEKEVVGGGRAASMGDRWFASWLGTYGSAVILLLMSDRGSRKRSTRRRRASEVGGGLFSLSRSQAVLLAGVRAWDGRRLAASQRGLASSEESMTAFGIGAGGVSAQDSGSRVREAAGMAQSHAAGGEDSAEGASTAVAAGRAEEAKGLEHTAGACLFWNTRQLCMPLAKDGYVGDAREVCEGSRVLARKAAVGKLRILMEAIDEHAPWLVALLEVDSARGRMRALRSWLRRRGFEMVHLPGEGSSRGGASMANGIVLAVSREVQLIESRRVAFRTLAVEAVHKKTGCPLKVAIMHGASVDGGPEEEEGERAFGTQLEAAAAWCSAHEGVLLADVNRVPCVQWRSPASRRLNKGDVEFRKLVGWRCECCQKDSEQWMGEFQFIGSQVDLRGVPNWTRWSVGDGLTPSKSRLDVGLACGLSRGVWIDAAVVRQDSAFSDHALIRYDLRVAAPGGPRGEPRPLPIRLGERPRADAPQDGGSAWNQLRRLSGEESFLDDLRGCLERARLTRVSAVEAMVSRWRSLGETAVQLAALARSCSGHGPDTAGRPGRFDNKSDRKVWYQRIKLAQLIARGARPLAFADWMLLFHPRSGMKKFCPRFSASAVASVDWVGYVRRCRRQWERALWFVERANREQDRRLADLCHRLEAAGGSIDSPSHINTLWRMIRNRQGSDRLRKLHVGDVKTGRVLTTADEDFLVEAGQIGEQFVRSMDRGCCPDALRAWLEVFVSRGSPAGGEADKWDVERAFSYADFLRTIQAMRGKAVGAGGLSVELLLAAAKAARWLFYQALLLDAKTGRFAASWKRVLYVLLRKPAPNDPDIIAQRREIALMPQDLKILLQGIRRDTFSKIGDDLGAEQFGWRAGYGCADPGLALAAVLQQARRLQHPVFVLYIDLANFFPAINRRAASMCEGWAGLPVRVAEVVEAVYGSAEEPDNAVRCQYDTAAGLGQEFRNHVGRLMGCPLSPDSAKILLESIISAVRRSVTGVALWPFEGEEIVQVAYADDWAGIFDDVGQLRKAWALWMAWAELIGARLGIKGFFKTVVTGSGWNGGHCGAVSDPLLRDNEGRKVPFASPEKVYKHLGVPRACCAEGSLAWTGGDGVPGIRDKLRACISRIRKLRRHSTSLDQFMSISNVLLGGMAGVYMQSAPVSFEETEEIERAWRRSFCRFAKRDFSAPIAELYGPGECWQQGRNHIYGVGSAALFAAVEKAMADPSPSPAREAVRSAIALAMYSWGCRSEPNSWAWGHLRLELRRSLRGKGLRGIGEAWMLAALEMERLRDPCGSTQARDEELRVRAWGRWRGLRQDGVEFNPLGREATAFQTQSIPLFEPREAGGLGLPVQAELLKLGVAVLSDLSASPLRGLGVEGRWLVDKSAVKARLGVGRLSPAVWKAWCDTVAAARDDDVLPVVGSVAGSMRLRYVSYRRREGDPSCQARILKALASEKGSREGITPVDVWVARFKKGFAPHAPAAAATNSNKVLCAKTALGWRLEKDGAEDFIDRGEMEPDVFPAAWREDWRSRMLELRASVKFDKSDGWPCRPRADDGVTDIGFMEALPPALQLAVRARGIVGRDAKVLQAGWGCKVPGWRVALDAQAHMWDTLCELQARLEFQFAFAVDASSGARLDERGFPLRDEWGWTCRSTSAVAVSHEGVTLGGILDPALPSDNYVGELVASVVALRSVPPGSSVLLIFDATSPLRAWRKFRRRCTRGKWKYQAASYLEEFEQLLRRQRLVFFCWQSSHCGEPVNEVADVKAERVRGEEAAERLTEREESPLFSMWPARPRGSLFAWARAAMVAPVRERLGSGGGHALRPEEDDWELGGWSELQGAYLTAMRRCTLMAGDDGHRDDRYGERDGARSSCPLGCTEGGSTWDHFAFRCEHADLREKRVHWREWLIRNRIRFDGLGTHKQVEAALSLLRGGSAPQPVPGRDPPLVLAQRLMAGLVEKVVLADRCQPGSAAEAVREMVIGGMELLMRAVELEAGVRRSVLGRILDNKKARAAFRMWGQRCARLGPSRQAGLWQLRIWRSIVEKAVALKVEAGDMERSEACARLRRVQLLTSDAHAALRREGQKLPGDVRVQWLCAGRWMQSVLRRGGRHWPLRAWCPEMAELREAAVLCWPPAATLGLCKLQQVRFLRGFNRRGEAIRVCLRIPGIRDLISGAFRRWFRAGGAPLLGRLARARAAAAAACKKAKRLKELQDAQVGLRRFCAGLACSGQEIPSVPVEERFSVVLGAAQKRRRVDADWQRGLRADKRGRWAVDDIADVRMCEGAEAGWEALVDWKGPFPACWVHSSNLCGPAVAQAREMATVRLGLKFRKRGSTKRLGSSLIKKMAPLCLGRRRSPRLAAYVMTAQALAQTSDEDSVAHPVTVSAEGYSVAASGSSGGTVS